MKSPKLPADFRRRAEFLRENGAAEQAATAWEKAATEVEAALRADRLEELTLPEASLECGYSTDHLRRLIRDGTIPNAGDEREYRILRRDLPRKPGHRVAALRPLAASSRTQAARAVARGEV